jgi:uncharacterized protein (DUF4415 family)
MKKRKPNPELIDEENPEWTASDFKRAKPAREVLPKQVGKEAAERLLKPRGRPKSSDAKVSISLRIPPQTLERWKASGPGWQTRMAETLTEMSPNSRKRTDAERM